MTARPLLDIFSPLPPMPTDIGNHTAGVLAELRQVADVRVWTSQPGPIELDVSGVQIRRYTPDALPVAELSEADATFYNIGNNAGFHRDIHAVARRVPGVVVLHDTRLQHFFAAYSEKEGPDRDYYLEQLRRYHGEAARAMGQDFIAQRRGLDDLVEAAPMTLAALRGATGAILHDPQACAVLQAQTHVPLYCVPLSFAFGPAPARPAAREAGPVRLIMFGFIGENRRLLPVLHALAGMGDRDAYRLDVFGAVEQEEEVLQAITGLGLEALVTLHGFVPGPVLDAALARADLAVNLRWPSMGEASGSQLRIWSAGLASLVTDVGWYAQLPPDTVFALEHTQEEALLVHHFRRVRQSPATYAAAGARGRAHLERWHAPRRYAEALLAVAAQHAAQHARCVGHDLAEAAARALLELGPPELARDMGRELSCRVTELMPG